MQLNWIKCQGDVWCKLNSVNLSHEHFNNRYGVYIIWHGGTKSAVVYVGQGNIKERLAEHRINSEIQSFESVGLYVTWASVPKEYRNGIELYLASKWKPIVGGNYPEVTPIEVNSPWQS
jgi:hypothetical protein